MRSDNQQTYGTISRFLHWSMALCFGFMLFTALAGMVNEDYFKALMYYHRSVGTILMALLAVRAVWAFLNYKRRPPAGNIAVKLGHLALYALMLFVPLVALIRQYGGARGALEVFGLEVMTGSAEKIDWMVELGGTFHGTLAWILFALAAGHIAMAVLHQIKGEKIINRMAGKP